MKVPIRFILALPCGLLLALFVFVGLLYSQLGITTVAWQGTYDLIQKKAELAAAIPGPRLLLVGGSGTLFGVNAKLIEQQTGCLTVNMGFHAGLGLDYILAQAQKTARPDDTILLIIEYQLYTNDTASEAHDDYILSRDPAYFHQMSLLEKINMATRLPFKRIQKGFHILRAPEKPITPHPPYTDGAKGPSTRTAMRMKITAQFAKLPAPTCKSGLTN